MNTPAPNPNEFTCSICGQTFTKALTEAEAEAQLAKEFPGVDKADCQVVCNDCFNTYFGGSARHN